MKQRFSYPEYDGPAIYEIQNQDNGKVYIGSCKNVTNRGRQHATALKNGKHSCKPLQADYNNGDKMVMRIVKKIHTTYRTELRIQEGKEVDKRKAAGQELYNVQSIDSYYIPKERIYWMLADLYCREHTGKTVDNYLRGNEAEAEYKYLKLTRPEEAERLKDDYREVIDYKNKVDFYRCAYGIDYDEFIEIPPDKRPRLSKRF